MIDALLVAIRMKNRAEPEVEFEVAREALAELVRKQRAPRR